MAARAKKKGAKKRRHTKTKQTLAKKADKYELYQQSVQEPESQCKFFERAFRKNFSRPAQILREDFCGTGAVCCEWVRGNKNRRAMGYDLDPEPLTWGKEHNISLLAEDAAQRVELLQGDVREVAPVKADIISAENFSYFIFKTRVELKAYFQTMLQNLQDEGLVVLDIMGGSQVVVEDFEESRQVDGFTYIWEQQRFDPITNECRFNIHFKFRDGSRLRRVFRYDWRLWSVREVCGLLKDAGFRRTDVYWEGAEEDGSGNGIFRVQKHAPSDPAWVSYIVAVK